MFGIGDEPKATSDKKPKVKKQDLKKDSVLVAKDEKKEVNKKKTLRKFDKFKK